MNKSTNIFHLLGDWLEKRRNAPAPERNWRRWIPSPGNVIFTLLMIALLILTQQAWANPAFGNVAGQSASSINYQGRLTATDGTPVSKTVGMDFSIWDAESGGNIVWGPESHSAVKVTDGLFNVGLGSLNGIQANVWNGDRYLEISGAGEKLSPRELIRSVPIAGMALTVPDGAISSDSLRANTASHYTADRITTTSNSFAPLQSVNLTLQRPGKAMVTWQSHVQNSHTLSGGDFQLYVDGVKYPGLRAVYSSTGAGEAGALTTISISGLVSDLSSGPHTFEIKWRMRNGGTLEIYERKLDVVAIGG